MPIFINSSFSLSYSNGCMLAFSSFKDIILIECARINVPMRKQLLAANEDIIFVEKL